jgi:trimeric autotransporter adhesin
MGSAGTEHSYVGNRSEFSSGGDGHRRKRVRVRPVLTVAVGLLLSVSLAACGGGFFIPPSLSSTFINPASATIATTKTVQLAVHGMYSDGSQQDVNGDSVTWSSSDPTIATVTSPGGLTTGASAGTATITATTTATLPGTGCQVVVSIANGSPDLSKICYGSSTETLTATINVNVTASNVNRMVINTTQGSTISQSTATTPTAPATLQFYAYANGDASNDATQSVTWTSSNPSVATIGSGRPSGNGLAVGVAAGTTNITATTTNSNNGQAVNSQTIVLTVQ